MATLTQLQKQKRNLQNSINRAKFGSATRNRLNAQLGDLNRQIASLSTTTETTTPTTPGRPDTAEIATTTNLPDVTNTTEVTPTVTPTVTPPDATDTRTQDEIAKSLGEGDLITQAANEQQYFGESYTPTSFVGIAEQQKARQLAERQAQQEAAARATQQFETSAAQSFAATGAAVGAGEAALAQGREGPVSAGAAPAAAQLRGVLQQRSASIQLSRESLQAEIAANEQALQQAQDASNAALVSQIQSVIDQKKQELKQTDTEYINALTAASEAEMRIKEFEVKTQADKGQSVRDSIGALGTMAGDLSIAQLTKMIQGSDVSLPEALLLQQATVLQGQIDTSKSAIEQATAMAELEQINKELENFGKTNDVLEFEYYQQLSDEGKKQYIALQNATDNAQLVKGEDGSMYAFDPSTATLTPLSTGASSIGGGIPNEAPTTITIGDQQVQAQPVFAERLAQADAAMFAATGQHIQINQDYRSYEDQKAIRDKFGYTDDSQPSGYNGLPLAAPPGTSFHNKGLAIDVSNWQEAQPYLQAVGIVNGLAGDMGHFSMGEMNPEIFQGDTDEADNLDLAIKSLSFGSVSAQETAINTVKSLVDSGQIDKAKEYVLTQVRANSSAAQQDVLDGKKAAIDALERIRTNLAEFEANGGDTNIFTGLKENTLQKGGLTSDPKVAEIANSIAIAIVDYRKAVSGAAFTESEAKAYDAIFPSIGKTAELNSAKINSLVDKLSADRDSFYKGALGETLYGELYGEKVEDNFYSGAGVSNSDFMTDEERGQSYYSQPQ